MAQHAVHICPTCGRKIKCDRPTTSTRTFEAQAPTLAPAGVATRWPSIQYEVYWGISKIADGLTKTLAVWLPANAIFYGVSAYNGWSPVAPVIFCVASYPVLLRAFGKVPSWHNAIETEPTGQQGEPQEQEDKREFVGWKLNVTDQTKTTMRLTMVEEWYTPPCPMNQAMSYALALVNNRFEWFDERHLEEHGANISSGNYRALRRDWLERKWCKPYGKKTIVTDKRMILKIAFDKPK